MLARLFFFLLLNFASWSPSEKKKSWLVGLLHYYTQFRFHNQSQIQFWCRTLNNNCIIIQAERVDFGNKSVETSNKKCLKSEGWNIYTHVLTSHPVSFLIDCSLSQWNHVGVDPSWKFFFFLRRLFMPLVMRLPWTLIYRRQSTTIQLFEIILQQCTIISFGINGL
jgi:hypothetical protein